MTGIGIGSTLDLSNDTIASIVNNDVDATECIFGFLERGGDLLGLGDVDFQDQKLVLAGVLGGEVRDNLWFTEGRDDLVTLF